MNKKLYLILIVLWLFNLATFANSDGELVAVFVNGDKNVPEAYKQLLQSSVEEGLVEGGYAIVEHNKEYLEMVRAYNNYLKGSSVSEFAFDNVSSEKLADKLCVLYIRKLSEGSYRIEATLTEYGRTDSRKKKSYPSLGEGRCNLDENTAEQIQIAVMELLDKLDLISPDFKQKMLQGYKKKKDDAEKDLQKRMNQINGTALAASFFVPGAGQMYKGEYGKGTGILISEVALVGGGVTCYFLGKKQLEIMQGRTVEYTAFNAAQKNYNTMRIISYSCYGAAAALYIFNLCHAYLMPPSDDHKVQQRLGIEGISFCPSLLPINEFSSPSYAMGAGVQIKF